MNSIKAPLNPRVYKATMNHYWYFMWGKYIESEIFKNSAISFFYMLITIIFLYTNFILIGGILAIVSLYLFFYTFTKSREILKIRKQFEITTQANVTINHITDSNNILIEYDEIGFYEKISENENSFFRWDKFSKVIFFKNTIFMIKNGGKLTYHFSKEEIGEENFSKLTKHISLNQEVEKVEIVFPFWYKVLLIFSHV